MAKLNTYFTEAIFEEMKKKGITFDEYFDKMRKAYDEYEAERVAQKQREEKIKCAERFLNSAISEYIKVVYGEKREVKIKDMYCVYTNGVISFDAKKD